MSNSVFDSLVAGTSVAQPNVTMADIARGPWVTPVALKLPLFDFQTEAVAHALRDSVAKPYAYIALDMGLGKTPCGITIAASCSAAGIKPTLIVVPPSLRVTWHREIVKFAPWLKVATVRTATPDEGDVIPNVDVLLIGDATVGGWADFLTGKVGALIVDEAHRFKNDSARSRALVQIASGVKKVKDPITKKYVRTTMSTVLPKMRIMMSGTPIPNGRHTELAPQVDVLGNDAWRDIGGKGIFWHHYAPKVDMYSRGNANGAELHSAMTTSWFFRRLRGDVIDLPAKGRSPLHLEGQNNSSSMKSVDDYKAAEKNLLAWLAGKQDGKVTEGQRKAKALIQLTSMRKLAGEAKIKSVIAHAKELLEEEPGGVFIVAEHSEVINEVLIGLAKYKPTVVQGGMGDAERQENIDQFVAGTSRVLVGQVKAAGVGLTLHGDGINHRVLVAQLPWTPADLVQAEDRLHRIGQTHDVMVEVALCAIDGLWTIDERLWAMLETKNFNATTITDGEGAYLLEEVQDGLLDSYRDQASNQR